MNNATSMAGISKTTPFIRPPVSMGRSIFTKMLPEEGLSYCKSPDKGELPVGPGPCCRDQRRGWA
jgi:hypothetical protein